MRGQIRTIWENKRFDLGEDGSASSEPPLRFARWSEQEKVWWAERTGIVERSGTGLYDSRLAPRADLSAGSDRVTGSKLNRNKHWYESVRGVGART
jgi:hypothetical protein